VPVLYTAGTGIDGHLEGLNAGIKVRQGNIADIAKGISELAATAADRKADLARCKPELQARFSRQAIVSRYSGALRRTIASGTPRVKTSGEEKEIREQNFPLRPDDAGEGVLRAAPRNADQRAALEPVGTIAEVRKK
jgi:hypothetical protein